MRQDNPVDIRKKKAIAKSMYQKRKVDQFVKWSFSVKNKIKWQELVKLQDELKIKVY